MTFLNAPMLLGSVAAVVPLLLHLLSRSQHRDVDWGAMLFLTGAEPQERQSLRLKQYALLGLRMGLVALLALALARPVWHDARTPPARPGATAAVILFDRSASMSLNDNGRTRLEVAREAVYQILSPVGGAAPAGDARGRASGLAKGDDLWLVPMGDAAAAPVHSADPADLVAAVRGATRAAGQADVAAAALDALDRLAASRAPNRELYVVCDRQASSWRNADADFAADWRERLAAMGTPPRVFVIPVGTDEADNVGIESVDVPDGPAVAEQRIDVHVRVRNYGAAPRAKVPVTLVDRGSATVDLPRESTRTVTIPVTFAEPGSHRLTARLAAPGLAFDKEYDFAIDVLRELRVLIVDGDEHAGAFRSESDFLRLALAPFRVPRRDAARVDVIAPDAWTGGVDLTAYRVVVLANVPQLTESQAADLTAYAFGGGGVLLAPGSQTRVENYNAMLLRPGQAVLPARLLAANPESDATRTTVAALDTTHRAFQFLAGRPDPAPPATVRRYFPVEPREHAAVLARYADGSPFLLESRPGRGRVLLLTTSVDTEWNSLPLTNFFLPFAQSAVRYLAAGRGSPRNLAPDEAIDFELDEPLDPRAPALLRPDRRWADPASLLVTQSGTHARIRYAQTDAPGVYELRVHGRADARPVLFAVQTPRSESDLAPLTEPAWKSLEQSVGFTRVDLERNTIAGAQAAARAGWELWLPLLAAAILLGVCELLVARRWTGRGA